MPWKIQQLLTRFIVGMISSMNIYRTIMWLVHLKLIISQLKNKMYSFLNTVKIGKEFQETEVSG